MLAICAASLATAKAQAPVLLSKSDSTRAIAFESETFLSEPFNLTSPFLTNADRRTRVIIFALNLSLQPGENFSSVSADAEDGARRHYPLAVEYVGAVPGQEWMSQIILKLNDDLSAVGDVLVRVSYRGSDSNRVRLGMGYIGGGPPDDAGAAPTVPSPHTIGGRITNNTNSGKGFAGLTVTLGDAQNQVMKTTATDSNGNYLFANLNAGGNYIVTPTRANYTFTPANQTFNNVNGSYAVNFSGALNNYTIGGHLNITGSKTLDAIKVLLTRDNQTLATAYTDASGAYAFTVPGDAAYSVAPSAVSYTFAPAAQSFANLSGNQTTTDFAALPVPITGQAKVLEFDGSQKSVDYGYYWHMNVEYGHFFWEFWAMPGERAGATYLISDGYGGAHSILFGFNSDGRDPGRYSLFGNVWDGKNVIYFSGDTGPAPYEWGHYAVGWDGANIITYLNGVPVGKSAFAGPRYTPGYFGGGGHALVGGSDHNNFDGRIAQVRAYEGSNPHAANFGMAESAFAPDTIFRNGGVLASTFFTPLNAVPNFSPGYSGNDGPGQLRGTVNGILFPCDGCPLPQYVTDSTAPDFAAGMARQAPIVPGSPAPVPASARVFDSFSRANSTYLFNNPGGLGATEGGSDGARSWQTGVAANAPQPFGILNGRAVLLANGVVTTWVETKATTGNLNIAVDRHTGASGSGRNTGLSFRVADAVNYFFAYTSDRSSSDASGQTLAVGYYKAGVRTDLVKDLEMPAQPWTTLRVATYADGRINVFIDSALVYQTTNNTMMNATGAGLYNNGRGLGLTNRWDNFTVSDAQ